MMSILSLQFCEFMSLCCLMHLSGSVVRILLDYVSHFHICSKLRLTLENQAEWPEICDILSELIRDFMTIIRLEARDSGAPPHLR